MWLTVVGLVIWLLTSLAIEGVCCVAGVVALDERICCSQLHRHLPLAFDVFRVVITFNSIPNGG